MSMDGKTILSCDIAQMCMTVMAKPNCTQYYKPSKIIEELTEVPEPTIDPGVKVVVD